ncbi:hypothetical protein JZ751_018538 [Albula glossodonta]|uniref:Nuclear receptor-binding factor 2 n=1 Tax=Albula glossodonta TaxID=121402 RepID=A0A8T2NQD5_9TELE|nr:hypothetical protein JZ751_018538 [Albula glossodonta]
MAVCRQGLMGRACSVLCEEASALLLASHCPRYTSALVHVRELQQTQGRATSELSFAEEYFSQQAHQWSRKADRLLAAGKYNEAVSCHGEAADLLQEAMKLTQCDQARLSMELQKDNHVKQQWLIKERQKWVCRHERKPCTPRTTTAPEQDPQRRGSDATLNPLTKLPCPGGSKAPKDMKTRLEEQETTITDLRRLVDFLLTENERLAVENHSLEAENALLRNEPCINTLCMERAAELWNLTLPLPTRERKAFHLLPHLGTPTRKLSLGGTPTRKLSLGGTPTRKLSLGGTPTQKLSLEGTPSQKLALNGSPTQKPTMEGTSTRRRSLEGILTHKPTLEDIPAQKQNLKGISTRRLSLDNISTQRLPLKGPRSRKLSLQVTPTQKFSLEGRPALDVSLEPLPALELPEDIHHNLLELVSKDQL